MDTISEILNSPTELSNNFDSSSSSSGSSNIVSIKCTKALFSKDGLKNNISSYILLVFITHFLLSIILFIKCGYPLLIKDLNDIIKEKEKVKKKNSKNNQMIISQSRELKKKAKKNQAK